MHRQALELREKVLGKEHPHTLTSMNNLAFVLSNLEKYDESEQWYEPAFTVPERILGGEHPNTFATRVKFAAIVRKRETADQASGQITSDLE